MRNLKKILALVLALMMTLSLMVTADAADLDTGNQNIKPEYQTAVDVLAALGVIQGNNGKYQPEGTITRAEFATMLYRIATGDVKEKNLSTWSGLVNFADVPATAWYADAVGYAQVSGFMQGDGTKFYPYSSITGYDAVVSLLRVLGYGQKGEYDGKGYQLNASVDGARTGITTVVGTRNLSGAATREMIAELVFDTLRNGDMVYLDPVGGVYQNDTRVDGITLGEMVFDLTNQVWDPTDNNNAGGYVPNTKDDAFGRPSSNVWTGIGPDGKTIEILVDGEAPVLTFTNAMDETNKQEITKALKSAGLTLNGTNATYSNTATAGSPTSTASALANLTSDHNIVEIYADSKGIITRIVQITTNAAIVEDDNVTDGTVKITATYNDLDPADWNGIQKDDVVLYTAADGDLQSVEILEGQTMTMTAFNSKNPVEYTIDGTTYTVSTGVVTGFSITSPNTNYLGKEMVYYIGLNDKIVYAKAPENAPESYDGYAIVLAADVTGGWTTGSSKSAQIEVLKTDGTTGVYDLALTTAGKVKNNETVDVSSMAEGSDLKNALTDVYPYTIENGVITLGAKLDNMPTVSSISKAEDAGTYVVESGNVAAIATGATSTVVDAASARGIINSDTVFIIQTDNGYDVRHYNDLGGEIAATKAIVIVEVTTGTDSKGAFTHTETVKYAIVGNKGDFTAKANAVAGSTVYVGTTVTTKKENNADAYYVTGYKADGTTIELSITSEQKSSHAAGVYSYNDNGSLGSKNTDTAFIDTIRSISGDTIVVGNEGYNIKSADQAVVTAGSKLEVGTKVAVVTGNKDSKDAIIVYLGVE